MNGVIGMADLLYQGALDRDQRQMVRTIRESGTALVTIINDILDFSKIDAGRMDIETVAMSVADLVEGSAATLATNAARKGVRLVTDIDPRIPATVTGDPVRVRQILFNLVGNAIKFSEEGEVVARAEPVGNGAGDTMTVRFSVIDSGIGISEEAQSRLFEAFSQAETSTTRRYGGTGLGLAICQRLTGLMDGTISVDSTLGEGSTFSVTLPFARDDEASATDRGSDLSGLRVLFISASTAVLATGRR